VQEWSSGPLIALCLARENAIEMWKKLMGPEDYKTAKESSPTCLIALYGSDGENPLYGTDNVSHTQRELRFFFPNSEFRDFS
jgi:nucleoside-diphosphate kinase